MAAMMRSAARSVAFSIGEACHDKSGRDEIADLLAGQTYYMTVFLLGCNLETFPAFWCRLVLDPTSRSSERTSPASDWAGSK
jgi:hypothetical protein